MHGHIPHDIQQVKKKHNTSSHTRDHHFKSDLSHSFQPSLAVILSMNKVGQILITAFSVGYLHSSPQKFSIHAFGFLCNLNASLVSSVFEAQNVFPPITIDLQEDKARSWQPGLSDLGVDQQRVWAQDPGWIYMRAVAAAVLSLCLPPSQTGLSYQELNFGGSQGMRHFFFFL